MSAGTKELTVSICGIWLKKEGHLTCPLEHRRNEMANYSEKRTNSKTVPK